MAQEEQEEVVAATAGDLAMNALSDLIQPCDTSPPCRVDSFE